MITFSLPIKTVPGLNAREHHMARMRRVRKERFLAKAMLAKYINDHPLPVTVTMVRVSAGSLDDDNLQGALKHIRDGVADAYGIDDAGPQIEWKYAQEKCPRKHFGVKVTIDRQVAP